MAIQEESQRILGQTEGGNDHLTMMAGRTTQLHNFQTQNHNLQDRKPQGQNSYGKKPGLICEHCGFKDHTKDTCYRIIAFPTDFKSKRSHQQMRILCLMPMSQ